MGCQYTGHLVHSTIQVVVDHDVIGDATARLLLHRRSSQPDRDLLVGFASASQPLGLDLARRGCDEDHQCLRVGQADLLCAPHLDLQQQIPARIVRLHRRAVEVAEVLVPLDEAAGLAMILKLRTGDEAICIGRLVRPAGPRRPRPAQLKPRIGSDQALNYGALADAARSADDDDQLGGSFSKSFLRWLSPNP